MNRFDLDLWDERLSQATAHAERSDNLYRKAKASLAALELELHHAPRLNTELAEQIAQAELDGEPTPEGAMIDVAVLRAKLLILKARVAALLTGNKDAASAKNQVEWSRYRQYQTAWATRGTQSLPMAAKSLRKQRPGLPEFADVSIGDAWRAYLLQHSGAVPTHPEQFGAWLGRIFTLPDPQIAWPAIRAGAAA